VGGSGQPAAVQHFRIDIEALENEISNSAIHKPAGNAYFCRTVSSTDAQEANIRMRILVTASSHVIAKQFRGILAPELLKHRPYISMCPVARDSGQFVYVLNPGESRQFVTETPAVVGLTPKSGSDVIPELLDRGHERRGNEGFERHV
jgi:hypothetical protein